MMYSLNHYAKTRAYGIHLFCNHTAGIITIGALNFVSTLKEENFLDIQSSSTRRMTRIKKTNTLVLLIKLALLNLMNYKSVYLVK